MKPFFCEFTKEKKVKLFVISSLLVERGVGCSNRLYPWRVTLYTHKRNKRTVYNTVMYREAASWRPLQKPRHDAINIRKPCALKLQMRFLVLLHLTGTNSSDVKLCALGALERVFLNSLYTIIFAFVPL